jgi:hypothetical protein
MFPQVAHISKQYCDGQYVYEVPIVKEHGCKEPRIPDQFGWMVEDLDDCYNEGDETVRIIVSKGGHSYLKERKYAKYIGEVKK